MNKTIDPRKNYVIAMRLGAIGGGLFVTLATKAIPKMLTYTMSGIMQSMMSQMSEQGCDPKEM